MATFYIELKELRKSKDITLEQIHNRTKINIRYLRAIEAGDFDIMPIPYLRLFLRAYAEEIGGNAERSLEQLDSFLGTASTQVSSIGTIKDDSNEELEIPTLDQFFPNIPDKKTRQDLIKAGILLIIFIFIIIVSQKIFKQKSSAIISDNGSFLQNQIKIISNDDLISGYIQDQFSEEIIPTKSPFIIKLIPRNEVAFSFHNSIKNKINYRLKPGVEKTLETFKIKSELLFTNTVDLSIYINGYAINTQDHKYPVKLTIKPTTPPSLIIQRYRPLQ